MVTHRLRRLTGMAIETDAGHRPGITPAITAGTTLGTIPGMIPGTTDATAITAIMAGILPGIMEVTIVLGDIGDGTVRDTTPVHTIVRVVLAVSTPVVRHQQELAATVVSTTAVAIATARSATVRI